MKKKIPQILHRYWRKFLLKFFGIRPNGRSRPILAPATFPKTIWLYWAQGEDDAPELVKFCMRSWAAMNPDWDLNFVSDANASRFVSMAGIPPTLRPAHKSDVLRVRLLAKYGGVWADATCLCTVPLDRWLPVVMQSGFFAYSRPARDRMISSWFLASVPNGMITQRLEEATTRYWRSRKVAGHYFWLHYLFEWNVIVDYQFRQYWRATPHLSADSGHLLQRHFKGYARATCKLEESHFAAIPVHKLTWKEGLKVNDIISYIMDSGLSIDAKRALTSTGNDHKS
ncbi:capsular polysaccharide synthesis protein [Devosia sp.]|uniref:capsular polysaccharide synthesis protein n=1 Tax=Devosia sp. TaxID=1871048 RepID=UPI003A914A95